MENRQYSHPFEGLERSVYKEITPSILDVPPVRKGFDPIQKKIGDRFGIALNLYLFKTSEVEFSLLAEGFLRMKAGHLVRRFGKQTVAHECVYYFAVPDFVDRDQIVIEWYNDHCVYIRQRIPTTPVHSSVFGPTPEELLELSIEDATAEEGISSQTASSGEKDSSAEGTGEREIVTEDASVQEESVADDASSKAKEVSSQTVASSEEDSQVPEEGESSRSAEQPSSLENYIKEIQKRFEKSNLKAAGKILKPTFVDKNYKPDADVFDLEREINDQRLRNKMLEMPLYSQYL